MRVCVVGGGISGLAAASHLADAGYRVTVLERADRCGGKLATGRVPDLDLDLDSGAESALARVPVGQRPEVVELLAELECEIVAPEPVKAQLYVDGVVRALPRTMVGVPYRASDLTEVLTRAGLRRAEQEPDLPAPPLDGDIAIGELVDRRFGPEVTDRVLEPMLGGIYAGNARTLSTAAVAPALWEQVRQGGPLTRQPPPPPSPGASGSPLVGTPGGMHAVAARLADRLTDRGVEIRTGATVRRLERTGAGWTLTVGPTVAPEALEADAVVLATAAAPTARLLAGLLPAELCDELGEVEYASVAVLTVLATGLDIEGSGLLVPPGELPAVKAFTHSSRKWGWLRERLDSAGKADHELVRISLGRAGQVTTLQLPDDALVARTLAEVATVPGWGAAAVQSWHLQRWGGGLPQYNLGHRERVARWQEAVAAVPGLAVCGALWDAVGIAGCLRSGRAAADQIHSQ